MRFLIISVAILALFGSCVGIYRSTATEGTITVTEKERVAGSETSQYLVWTEGGEVFKVGDSIPFWEWGASDRYGQLRAGATYEVTVAGWRIPWLSMYRNVVRLRRVEETNG